MKFAVWQLPILLGITGVTLKQIGILKTWEHGYVTGIFLMLGIMMAVNHYIEYKEAKKKNGK